MVTNLRAVQETGDEGSIPGSGRSPRKKCQPTPVFLPGESQGQRSLVGYSPWSHRESDTTERLSVRTEESPGGGGGGVQMQSPPPGLGGVAQVYRERQAPRER